MGFGRFLAHRVVDFFIPGKGLALDALDAIEGLDLNWGLPEGLNTSGAENTYEAASKVYCGKMRENGFTELKAATRGGGGGGLAIPSAPCPVQKPQAAACKAAPAPLSEEEVSGYDSVSDSSKGDDEDLQYTVQQCTEKQSIVQQYIEQQYTEQQYTESCLDWSDQACENEPLGSSEGCSSAVSWGSGFGSDEDDGSSDKCTVLVKMGPSMEREGSQLYTWTQTEELSSSDAASCYDSASSSENKDNSWDEAAEEKELNREIWQLRTELESSLVCAKR